jgi:hypothetical protein
MSKKNLIKSHTIQLSTVLLVTSLILSLPEVQAIIPDNYAEYVTALLAVLAIIRKYLQE